jgi:NAD(P)H-dependent FMN reductase
MSKKPKLAIIIASGREGRFADRIVKWVASQITGDQRFDLHVIDPRKLHVTAWHGDMTKENLEALKSALGGSDAFIIATPEYNHSFPATVKSLIDAGKAEWEAKPVAFVSYGGISGGLRAVEGLRLVLAELHAVTLRDSVSFAMPFQRFSEDGVLSEPQMAEQAMALMLNRLEWWTAALNHARSNSPYALSAQPRA